MRKETTLSLILLLLSLSLFMLYSQYRQRYVGACDWYAYYSQAQLLKSGQLHMETKADPDKYPSAAPLGYYVRDGKVVPHFPPGYPILMAIFGFAGLEFYVNPLLGALTFLLMFMILVKVTGRYIAMAFSLLWAFSPIVIWGSTFVMSDMGAGFFLLLSFYLFGGKRYELSGIALGFSLLVRPSSILFLLVLLPLLYKEKGRIRFAVPFVAVGMLSAGYNWYMHGLPWKYGFYETSSLLSTSFFPENIAFYSVQLFQQYTPVLLLPALFALWKHRKDAYIYGIWLFSFILFYSFIILGREAWWGIRFLLPAMPALVILAAMGMKTITVSIAEKWKKSKVFITPALIIFTLVGVGYFINFEAHRYLFTTDKAKLYYDMAVKVKELVPPNSFVGSFETSGALKTYAGLEPFNLNYSSSFRLIKRQLRNKNPVYVVLEPGTKGNFFFLNYFERFRYEKVATLNCYGQCDLFRIIRRRFRRRKLEETLQ
jgi:hypothetical protein